MLARALAAGLLLAQASAQLGFNYTAYPCAPQGLNGKNLITGNKAYVCVTINGRSTAVFTPSVDSFTAIQLSSCGFPEFSLSCPCLALLSRSLTSPPLFLFRSQHCRTGGRRAPPGQGRMDPERPEPGLHKLQRPSPQQELFRHL
jgi:hypothetical protein